MVALKILSKDDVIAAYLKSFGFSGKRLTSIVAVISADLKTFSSGDGETLIKKVDSILLKTAHKVFPDAKLEDEQLLAQFKLCFLLSHGADKCSLEELQSLSLPPSLIEEMRHLFVVNVPVCHYLDMPAQSLDYTRSPEVLHE